MSGLQIAAVAGFAIVVAAALMMGSNWKSSGHRSPPIVAQVNLDVAVQQAIDKMTGSDMIDAVEASMELGRIGRPALPALIAHLTHPKAGVRTLAASALGDIGAPAGDAVPGLIALLKDQDAETRMTATESLGKIGAQADLVVPALEGLANDPEAPVRSAASAALMRLRPSTAAADALVRTLRSGQQMERLRALEMLAEQPALAKANIGAVIDAVGSTDYVTASRAMKLIGKFGPDGVPALPALLKQLDSPQTLQVHSVITAIGQIGPGAREAVPHLVPYLSQSKAKLDPEAAAVIARAARALGRGNDGIVNLAAYAAIAIDRIEPGHGPARAVIQATMLDKSLLYDVRLEAASHLFTSVQAKDALEVMIGIVKDRNDDGRRHAAFALAGFGRAEAVPGLIEALSFQNDLTQISAAKALGELGAPARMAVPALRAAMKTIPGSEFRATAEAAIARIEQP